MAHCYCLENNGSFSMVAGESGPIAFHMVDGKSKVPFDISGYDTEFTVVDCVNQNMVQFSKKPSDNTVVKDVVIIQIEENDTKNLLPGKYLYQLEIQSDDAGPEVVSEGSLFVRRNFKEVGAVEH